MPKNAVNPFKLIDAGDMSGNLTAVVANGVFQNGVLYLDNIGFQYIWTGTPTGTIALQFSQDGTNWTTMVLSPAITQPAGSAGNDGSNVNQFPYKYIRVTYTRSSGSGSLTVWMSAKEI